MRHSEDNSPIALALLNLTEARMRKDTDSLSANAEVSERWLRFWEAEDVRAPWLNDEIPNQLTDALKDGFFPPASRVVDIGCGKGNIAAFLASKGLDVLAVDIAPGAIAKAKDLFAEQEGKLEFAVMDLCKQAPGQAEFDCVFDRGCFHLITDGVAQSLFAQNLAEALKPGGRLLMIHKVGHIDQPVEIARAIVLLSITKTFSPWFNVVSNEGFESSWVKGGTMHTLALRLERKGN